MSAAADDIKPVLPKSGQLMVEDPQEFVMCKPRLIPLKSCTLEKLEKMQQEAQAVQEERAMAKSSHE